MIVIPRRGDGQAVLITGASRGIGRAIALRFAAEGYHVVAMDIPRQQTDLAEVQALIRQENGRCDLVFGDVSNPESVRTFVDEAKAIAGHIDVLVNNAGVLSLALVDDIEPDEWDRMYDVNTKGTFMVCKALLAQFREAGKGRIVNIASIGGKRGAPLQAHYCSSKAAVISFTHILAQEVAKDGITVNAVCPGIIDTDMGRNNYRDAAALQAVKDKTALGRLGYPDDVVGAVAFFASDDASFISGQALNVCGGIIFH